MAAGINLKGILGSCWKGLSYGGFAPASSPPVDNFGENSRKTSPQMFQYLTDSEPRRENFEYFF